MSCGEEYGGAQASARWTAELGLFDVCELPRKISFGGLIDDRPTRGEIN
jgi:hypothetical protein